MRPSAKVRARPTVIFSPPISLRLNPRRPPQYRLPVSAMLRAAGRLRFETASNRSTVRKAKVRSESNRELRSHYRPDSDIINCPFVLSQVVSAKSMAYVPGHKHDCFLSYAHMDAAWVSALQEQLTERMLHRLGCECDVWQDENKLQTGQNFPAELDRVIRASTAFIAVLSRSYQSSTWCEKELDVFLDESASVGLETGGYGRVLKVIRFPWLDNAHEGFLSEYQHILFFDRDAKTGQEREFKHTSESFRKAVDKLSFHIEKLLDAVLRGMEKVFVARAAGDAAEEREAIIREIKAAGYALSPPPVGAIRRGLNRGILKQYIGQSSATVHLLGAEADQAVREQIDLALEAEKKVIFCLARGHESASGEQKELIEQIRENRWGLRQGTWALLESRSPAVLRQDLIGALAPPRPAAAGGPENAARVYLLCDPTTPEDVGFAREVQGRIREKEEKIHVDLPPPAADTLSPGANHERLLRDCDGLLLYHEKAPPKWVSRNFMDLLTAADRADRHALRSRAMLVRGDNIAYPGLNVIQRRDPFDLQQLESFLAPLRGIKAEHGGADVGR